MNFCRAVTLITLLAIPWTVCHGDLIPVAGAGIKDTVHVNYVRTAYEEWTVQVMPGTVFFPMGDVPNPFSFSDLEVGQMILAEGIFWNGSPGLNAYWVFVFGPGGQRDINSQPSSLTDYIYGAVTRINPETMQFSVWVQQEQGECRTITALPNAVFVDAPPGEPLRNMSFFELLPGDPLMIHGYLVGDVMKGFAFVRSFDWFPPTINREFETLEVYGWVEDRWIDFQGNRVLEIRIDTMTGDPNHQTFTRIVDVQGDRFEFPWGHLIFPPYALNETTAITVSGDFMFWWTLQNIYEFQPEMTFNEEVEIELRYFNLPENVDPNRINLSYYDEETGRWRIATHMTHHSNEHCFRGMITHFSRYSLSTNNRPLEEVIQGQ